MTNVNNTYSCFICGLIGTEDNFKWPGDGNMCLCKDEGVCAGRVESEHNVEQDEYNKEVIKTIELVKKLKLQFPNKRVFCTPEVNLIVFVEGGGMVGSFQYWYEEEELCSCYLPF